LGRRIIAKLFGGRFGIAVRPHLSLRIDELETPHQAFIRKMKAEV